MLLSRYSAGKPSKTLEILEVHRLEKTEKPLQILHFFRFCEYI